MRRPRQSLNSSRMPQQTKNRRTRLYTPNVQSVVVPPRSQLLLIKRPLQPTHLLLMPYHLLHVLVFNSDIPHQNVFIPWTTCKHIVRVPSQSTHPSTMSLAGRHFSLLYAVPELHLAHVCSDSQDVTWRTRGTTCHQIAWVELDQSDHLRIASVPQIDRVRQPHS